MKLRTIKSRSICLYVPAKYDSMYTDIIKKLKKGESLSERINELVTLGKIADK